MSQETAYVNSLGIDAPTSATMRVQSRHDRLASFYARHDPECKDLLVIYKPVLNGDRYELTAVNPVDFNIIQQLKVADTKPDPITIAGVNLKVYPPAGTTVETKLDNGCWYKCYIIGFDEDGNCIVDENKRIIRVSSPDLFRPLTEGREELIVEMIDCLRSAKNINQTYDVTVRQLLELVTVKPQSATAE